MTSHYIWHGNVGIELQPQRTNNGAYFWTFRLKRVYKQDQDPNFKIGDHFTIRNAEALGVVIGQALWFMQTTDPETWLQAVMN